MATLNLKHAKYSFIKNNSEFNKYLFLIFNSTNTIRAVSVVVDYERIRNVQFTVDSETGVMS